MTLLGVKFGPVSTYLPSKFEPNSDLAEIFPEWDQDSIFQKTGIAGRHKAAEDEYVSDMAYKACLNLLAKANVGAESIDFLILVTSTGDFILPPTSCLIHERLGMREDAGALDVNLACSGYVYALSVAKGLIESGQAKRVLVVTGDTYTKLVNPKDRTVRPIFGDAATATMLEVCDDATQIQGFAFGTDGSGAKHLMVPGGGFRPGIELSPESSTHTRGLETSKYDLYMNGPEVFKFTLRIAEKAIEASLVKVGLKLEDIDLFIFHQANKFMLEHLVRKLGLPPEKCPIILAETGNTTSSTIPIVLEQVIANTPSLKTDNVMLLGFGVGFSWASCVISAKAGGGLLPQQ